MFNLEIFQYIVFGILVIPPFIIGFKKGWKAALFSTITLLLLSGLIVGISFIIYNNTLWPLFSKRFIKSHLGTGLDMNTLKDISKPSIIIIVLGIMIIPSLFIAWVIFTIFKKLLTRHMNPRLKKLETNKVRIWRKNNVPSKIAGSVIFGTSGLLIASTAAAAVATFTVPSTKENFFTKATSLLGRGYTFNNGYYDYDYQKMYEFFPMTHMDKEMGSFKKLFAMESSDAPKSSDITNITSSKDWYREAKELMKRKRSAVALVKLAISDKKEYDLTNANSSIFLNNLESIIGNSKLKLNLPQESIDEIISFINEKRILSFNRTGVYINWQNAIETVKKLNRDLNKLNETKNKLYNKKLKLKTELENLKYDENTQKNIISYTASNKNSLEKVKNDMNKILGKTIPPMDKAKTEMYTAEQKYNKDNLTYISKKNAFESANNDVKNNNDEIKRLERENNSLKDNISRNSSIINSLSNINTGIDKDISVLNDNINTKTTEKRNQENIKSNAEAEYLRQTGIYNDLSNDKVTRDAAIAKANIEQQKINSSYSKINSLKIGISNLNSRLNDKKINKQQNQNKIWAAKQYNISDSRTKKYNEDSINARKLNIQKLIDDKNYALLEKNKSETIMETSRTLYHNTKGNYDAKVSTWQKAKNNYDYASKKYEDNETRHSNAVNSEKNIVKSITIKDVQIKDNESKIVKNKNDITNRKDALTVAKSTKIDKEKLKISENIKFDDRQIRIKNIYQSALE